MDGKLVLYCTIGRKIIIIVVRIFDGKWTCACMCVYARACVYVCVCVCVCVCVSLSVRLCVNLFVHAYSQLWFQANIKQYVISCKSQKSL